MVRAKGQKRPLPMRRNGTGTVITAAIALTLATCQDGFILMDQTESLLHHSKHRTLWTTILEAARTRNIQVVAVTQSAESERTFQDVLKDSGDSRNNPDTWATVINMDSLLPDLSASHPKPDQNYPK